MLRNDGTANAMTKPLDGWRCPLAIPRHLWNFQVMSSEALRGWSIRPMFKILPTCAPDWVLDPDEVLAEILEKQDET